MQPRGVLDIGWADLAHGLWACARPGRRGRAQGRIEAAWTGEDDCLCTLSVRSGFETLLTALRLPAGAEVLTSALTIADMPRILTHHGLVPIPVDLDMDALRVDIAALQRAVTKHTQAILVAHVFGSRMPLDDVADFARHHDLMLVEDCAQAYTGPTYTGHRLSDVSMFSFGPIKTSTALGGAMLRVRDRSLLESMRLVQSRLPVQTRRAFVRKVVKYAGVKLVTRPTAFGLLARACRWLGADHDTVINQSLRGFAGPDFFSQIRQRPSYPLLVLLERRLRSFDVSRIERRRNTAAKARASMPTTVQVGARARCHSHWVFPVSSARPDALMRHLWAHGFDATRGRSSLAVVDPPLGHPELEATTSERAMARIVYLPVHPQVSAGDLARLGRLVTDFETGSRTEAGGGDAAG